MDQFLPRKRQKCLADGEVEDSTEYKLTVLQSLCPHLEPDVLLDLLAAHNGSLSLTKSTLSDPTPPKCTAINGHQTSLSSYLTPISSPSKIQKASFRKGKTVHLYCPEDVAAHTPCTIIHNFLAADEANSLLIELLEEARTFEKNTFKLFDNVVKSPHTACFYVNDHDEVIRQKTKYYYNGKLLSVSLARLGTFKDIRQHTPQMLQISPKIAAAVNTEVSRRIKTYPNGLKLHHQSPKSWCPNAAFVNCYNGPSESVGYHSDQLTYIGPRAIIGSLSLGVSREFRLRKISLRESGSESKTAAGKLMESDGQISIHLPHNSLLVMHAEMQEEWKHCIAPASAIDFHPISGSKRINITYRDYRASLHPRYTPVCRCSIPMLLRTVQRQKNNLGRYFWMCQSASIPGMESCGDFQWAEFDKDGEPVWNDDKKEQRLSDFKEL
ncbi:GRF zinc finger domain-containing protein [Blumeria hordei DH14]|uniref:GRF zinc finger domain-containing protein n=1 Tax=Blumeria graminis f. sp. hordei (strain DH14) TaxID=546991 RepID=N1JFS7_BLUG1|nr:GRF zinc finger domain-containing protein [Blumeria hordei DH14]